MDHVIECRDGVCFIEKASQDPILSDQESFQVPSPTGQWTVYGRKNCFFCTAAQKMLQGETEYTYHDVEAYGGAAEVRHYLNIPESHTTVPMIFFKNKFLGGYQQLKESFERLKKEEEDKRTLTHNETSRIMTKCGGLSDARDPSDEVKDMVATFKDDILSRIGKEETDTFETVSYASQVVAGTNYFVKVLVNKTNDTHIHVRVFRPLPYTKKGPKLHENYQYPKKADDKLEYF